LRTFFAQKVSGKMFLETSFAKNIPNQNGQDRLSENIFTKNIFWLYLSEKMFTKRFFEASF